MAFVMDLHDLPDEDLVANAKEWRQRALRGDKDAHGLAHELERELRRRFPRDSAPQALSAKNTLGYFSSLPLRRWMRR